MDRKEVFVGLQDELTVMQPVVMKIFSKVSAKIDYLTAIYSKEQEVQVRNAQHFG